jgi:hypothetical protein
MSPSSSGFEEWAKQESSMKHEACYLLHAGFLLGPFFEPEDGSGIFLRNIDCFSTDYMALYSRKQHSS